MGSLTGAAALGTGLGSLWPSMATAGTSAGVFAATSGRAPPTRRFEFTFARLRYDSGDWDYNPKVCANLLDAVVQYTDIPVDQQEVVITADSAELTAFPFCS